MASSSVRIRKCPKCVFGTWLVGISALTWGALAIAGVDLAFHGAVRVVALIVAAVGVSFLIYQPPFASCPACVARNNLGQHRGTEK